MGTRKSGSAQPQRHFQVGSSPSFCIVPKPKTIVYRFLTGDTDGAKADLEESVKLVPSLTQSWVKIASVYMEQSDVTKTFEAFDEAIKHNASDPDIYYHRGQGMLLDVRVNTPVLIPL